MTYSLLAMLLIFINSLSFAGDLDSWNDGPTRQAIINYVKKVTDKGSSSYIPKESRIAVFDNDGTLWAEQPVPFQFHFAFDRVKQLAPKHPEWKTEQPFKAVIENDHKYLSEITEKDILKILSVTHLGMTQDEFMKTVGDWLKVGKDPKSGMLYTQRIYQPMVELLSYLRANDFKTYISTGGGTEFVRNISETAYGIPPEQVIGSSVVMKYEMRNGKPVFQREAKLVEPINLDEGKPVNIQRIIGRVPVIAVGNSDGDLQMLQYAASNTYPSLSLLVHHDDAVREFAYDHGAEVVLQEAKAKKWTVVSMKKDFNKIFPTSPRSPAG